MMEVRFFNEVPKDAMDIRITVFVDEQGFVDEFDHIDKIAVHGVMYDDEKPVGTFRIFNEDGGKSYHIGRIAVLKEYRGSGVGLALMEAAKEKISELGGEEIVLSSQMQAKGFYEKAGYVAQGEVYLDQHCPHIDMSLKLD